jgi:hypothetical protein
MNIPIYLRHTVVTLGVVLLGLTAASMPLKAQTVYREYLEPDDDLTEEDIRQLSIRQGRRIHNSHPSERWIDEEEDEEDDEDDGEAGGDPRDARRGYKDDDLADVSFFYEELEADGRWFEHPRYGYVWTPHRIERDWRPYTRGHWVFTDDYGWYWVSEEPFGWATYHYGRWFYEPRYGWVWVPGTRWAPAWVAWRSSSDYIGWAPLPPDAYWDHRRATIVHHETLYASPSFAISWTFVEPVYMTRPAVWRHAAPHDRVPMIVQRARPATHYALKDRRIINRGISVAQVERATRQPVPRLTTARGTARPPGEALAADHRTVRIFQPDMSRRAVQARRKGRQVPWAANAPLAERAPEGVQNRPVGSPSETATPRRTAKWVDVDRQRGDFGRGARDDRKMGKIRQDQRPEKPSTREHTFEPSKPERAMKSSPQPGAADRTLEEDGIPRERPKQDARRSVTRGDDPRGTTPPPLRNRDMTTPPVIPKSSSGRSEGPAWKPAMKPDALPPAAPREQSTAPADAPQRQHAPDHRSIERPKEGRGAPIGI